MSASEPPSLPPIAILGGGSMGAAIVAGLSRAGAGADRLLVTTRSAAAAARLSGQAHTQSLEADPTANLRAVRGARLVIVAVKPAMLPELLREIADALEADAVVVSVAAGVTTATIESLVPNAVVRAMPNTPALVGRGITGLAVGTRAEADQLALVEAVFRTVGEVLVVPEEQLDALTAVSGSGPAYLYLVVERWTDAAIELGFTPAQARMLVEGTVRGASELLAASDAEPAELRRRVTSPGGTTERAIAVLEEARLAELFERAARAAVARARELAEG